MVKSEIRYLSVEEQETSYNIHPIVDLYPKLSKERNNTLKENIKGNGVITPVLMIEGKKKRLMLIDGKHRSRAAETLGIELPYQVLSDYTEQELRSVLRGVQSTGREKTKTMVACFAAKLIQAAKGASKEGDPFWYEKGMTLQEIADIEGISLTMLERARTLLNRDEKLFNQVASGEVSVVDALEQTREPVMMMVSEPKGINRNNEDDPKLDTDSYDYDEGEPASGSNTVQTNTTTNESNDDMTEAYNHNLYVEVSKADIATKREILKLLKATVKLEAKPKQKAKVAESSNKSGGVMDAFKVDENGELLRDEQGKLIHK